MKKEYDYLLVGAGLFNAVFAQQAKMHGKRCLVIDKRPNLGGNVYCEDVNCITVHKYGPHIFHTKQQGSMGLRLLLRAFQSAPSKPSAALLTGQESPARHPASLLTGQEPCAERPADEHTGHKTTNIRINVKKRNKNYTLDVTF